MSNLLSYKAGSPLAFSTNAAITFLLLRLNLCMGLDTLILFTLRCELGLFIFMIRIGIIMHFNRKGRFVIAIFVNYWKIILLFDIEYYKEVHVYLSSIVIVVCTYYFIFYSREMIFLASSFIFKEKLLHIQIFQSFTVKCIKFCNNDVVCYMPSFTLFRALHLYKK